MRQSFVVSTLERRFWAKVDRGDPDACWLWTDAPDPDGYGRLHPDGRHGVPLRAHRVALALHLGRALTGDAHHTCEVRLCVNFAHLVEQDHAEHGAHHGAWSPWESGLCQRGHDITDPANLYKDRRCKPCRLDASRRYYRAHA